MVSIHAPARGATPPWLTGRRSQRVSIHAPARGATFHRDCRALCILVSIHAPARGATCCFSGKLSGGRSFNPRARAGRDYFSPSIRSRAARFQSTRPRGARRRAGGSTVLTTTFQSTRPRGARLSVRNRLYFRQDTTNIPTTLTLLPEKAVPHPEKEVFFVLLQHDRACADLPQKTAGLRSSHQKMSGPSGSYAALHPKCSILPLQLFPSR